MYIAVSESFERVLCRLDVDLCMYMYIYTDINFNTYVCSSIVL